MSRPRTRTNEELLAAVIDEMHRLSVDGRAPSLRQWNERRLAGIPTEKNVRMQLKLRLVDIAALAGLQPHQMEQRAKREMGAVIERHVAAGAELADWNSRYHAALHVLPTPTRRETVQGRTISGEPCVIYREYFLVR